MKLLVTLVTSLGFIVSAALAQPAPTFEAADVHVAPPTSAQFLQTHSAPSGRYEMRNATMLDLIRTAYNVDAETIYGGPNWLESDRFDVIAKAAAKTSEDDRRLMLRALLSERFKLAVHNEPKPLDVFSLTAGKKVLMKESSGEGPAKCVPPPPSAANEAQPYAILNCSNMSMAEFAKQFRQMAGGYVTHQMIDLTNLKGNYDFTIKWTGRGRLMQLQAANDPNAEQGISFFDAVDKQLGLKLAPEKRPVPSLVVDSVERVPMPNPPGMKSNLLAVPTEFDAAVVKQSAPNATGMRFSPRAGGQIDITNVPLKMLIAASYSLENDQERVVDGPKWIDSEKFDIVAKTSDFPVDSPPPIDSVRVMLRNLLIDRFKLAAHMADREKPVWLVTVAKSGSKLKPADPQSRSGCKPMVANPTPNGTPMVSMSCTNTTMEQLAVQMHNAAGGYVDKIAVDMTGIKGGYDFTITWTPKGMVVGGRGGDSPQSDTSAADPSGGMTFFDAVEKQLGLHLETGKHAVPVLIVDKVDHLSAEN